MLDQRLCVHFNAFFLVSRAMGKILIRYLVREITIPFFISLLIFTCILFTTRILKLVELVVNKGVSVLSILKMLFFVLPSFFSADRELYSQLSTRSSLENPEFDSLFSPHPTMSGATKRANSVAFIPRSKRLFGRGSRVWGLSGV